MSLSTGGAANPSTRTRTRRKPGTPHIEMPAPVKGKFFCALKRGITYHLATEPDIIFKRGQVKEVSAEVYEHLASNAFDITNHFDPDCGRVRRKLRKFSFSPPLDEEQEITYPDLSDGA